MKITITRSFSDRRQRSQFEPIEAMCSATMELETLTTDFTADQRSYAELSEKLDNFVRTEVQKTLDKVIPSFKEDPQVVRGNELLSQSDRKSIARINSAKSPAQKKFFAKDEAQKNSYDFDDKQDNGDGQYQRGESFDKQSSEIIAERNKK